MKFTSPRGTRWRLLALLLMLCGAAPPLSASEALMDLLAILRDKGTLTADEYAMLVEAAKADQQKTAAAGAASAADQKTAATEPAAPGQGRPKTAPVAATSDKLAWAEKIKLKGDLRTRYEYLDDEGAKARGRGRLRYRLGVIANPVDAVEVGAGLASGTGDQRSTNQSFGDAFSGKDVNLDYAYMQYAPGTGLSAVAGKFSFKNYLWTPSDVMWDTDINPEGLSLDYVAANRWGNFFGNSGVWVLEENGGSSDDPYMVYGQVGQVWKAGNWFGTVAAAAYVFADINYVTDIARHEGRNTDSELSSVNLAVEFGRAIGPGEGRILGEYIDNVETDTEQDVAWAIGAKYAWGKWSAKYLYADVELNAVPDFLPDSDRNEGLPGMHGHEFEIQYELMKQVAVGLDYYRIKDTVTSRDGDRLQADLNVKF